MNLGSPIDWTRVAKPQPDAYDMFVIRNLDVLWKPPFRVPDGPRLLGNIRVVTDVVPHSPDGKHIPARQDEDWTELSRHLLPWANGASMLQAYLDEFQAFRFKTFDYGRGCTSGHQHTSATNPLHQVYVTVNDPHGCSQGIYHEVAHLRLESLGIGIEKYDDLLILNAPDELYDSSVRFDKKRPISAVLHGVYAWVMFTENDYWSYKAGVLTKDEHLVYSERNIPKMVTGMRTVEDNIRTTPEGTAFITGLSGWVNDLAERYKMAERYKNL